MAVLLSLVWASGAPGQEASDFDEGSAERAALTRAEPYLENEDFFLRSDYWSGELSGITGKALRLQCFKGNQYSFFFAGAPAKLPEGAILNMKIVDKGMREIANWTSLKKDAVLVAEFKPKETNLYLVLMSLTYPAGSDMDKEVPCCVFFGYE